MTTNSNELPSFGALLKTFRKRGRFTQQQLAEAIGMQRHAIGRWEQGEVLPASKTMVLELARHLHLDEPETRRLLEASLTALSPYWHVPFPRNPFFTGREEVLETLHAHLGVDHIVALTQSYALHGLGGVGKTQIALEYVYRHALSYSAVFWIGAETNEQIVSSFLRVASVLGLPEREETDQSRVVAAVQRWLTTHGQWLLIWDNVENLNLFSRFLPPIRQGTLLLTTRCQTLGTLARGIGLEPMRQEEGILFVLRRAKVLSPEATREHLQQLAVSNPGEYTAAEQLVAMMGGLPLALDQAGAYIEEMACGLAAYLQHYEKQRSRLLDRRGTPGEDHPQSVAATFRLIWQRVQRELPEAADVLRVCALVHAEAIPEEVFVAGATHLGPLLESLAADPCRLDQMIGALRCWSLVQRQPEIHTLSLHRLVQTVLREQMSEQEQVLWLRRVLAALNTLFPDDSFEVGTWDQCERLLRHMLTVTAALPDRAGEQALAEGLRKAADYLRERVQYEQAEPLLRRALDIGEQSLGETHPDLARLLDSLALLYDRQGRYEQAEPLFERALSIREQLLGPGHSLTADLLTNLAILYTRQGKYAQAEPLFERALRAWEQTWGPGHPEVARPLSNLAECYTEQGKYEQAEPLFLRAIHLWEEAFGSENPDLAYALDGLADLYYEQGKYAQAEPLYKRTLHNFEQALGPEHRLVAYPLTGLANLFRDQGQYAEAESHYQRARSIREQHLGQFHPETAQTLHDLATFRLKQGNLSEALLLAERALAIREQLLPAAHPKTVATRKLYAQLLQEPACVQEEAAVALRSEGRAEPGAEDSDAEEASLLLHEADHPSSSEQDPFQEFLSACCEWHPRAWCRSADLWQAYVCWAEEHQERFPLSRGAFIRHLKAHGCRVDRTKTTRIWRGIALVSKNDDGR